jgi:hypothetical protein
LERRGRIRDGERRRRNEDDVNVVDRKKTI